MNIRHNICIVGLGARQQEQIGKNMGQIVSMRNSRKNTTHLLNLSHKREFY